MFEKLSPKKQATLSNVTAQLTMVLDGLTPEDRGAILMGLTAQWIAAQPAESRQPLLHLLVKSVVEMMKGR